MKQSYTRQNRPNIANWCDDLRALPAYLDTGSNHMAMIKIASNLKEKQ